MKPQKENCCGGGDLGQGASPGGDRPSPWDNVIITLAPLALWVSFSRPSGSLLLCPPWTPHLGPSL